MDDDDSVYSYEPAASMRHTWHNKVRRLHRAGGPAIIWSDGDKWWYNHGRMHRTDGPAILHTDGHKEWWIDNDDYEFEEWLEANTEISEEQKVMLKLKYG